MHYDYDLFVIGAGSAGVRAARIAASYGARVAIAEKSRVGGTCVIRGCVPKKLFVIAGRYADYQSDAIGYGWSPVQQTFNWGSFKAARDNEILRLEGLYNNTLKNNSVEIFRDGATILGPNSIQLNDTKNNIHAKKILIATGGIPARPNIAGSEHAIISDDIFELSEQPKSLAIIGGGFIALEFACAFSQLGTKVTLIHRASKLLRGFDEDLQDIILEAMRIRGIELIMDTSVVSIHQGANTKELCLSDGKTIYSQQALFAVGRSPNTYGLGLSEIGVKTDNDGAIIVDKNASTSIPTIFAVGDVTNRVNLTPIAIREGHAFADREFGNQNTFINYDVIPKAVFTTPEIATVGLSEAEAKEKLLDFKVYKTQFRPMAATLSGRKDKVFMKLIVENGTDIVLGVHICAPEAAEMIQLIAIAVQMKATKADFDATIAVHPTMAEELVTLRG